MDTLEYLFEQINGRIETQKTKRNRLQAILKLLLFVNIHRTITARQVYVLQLVVCMSVHGAVI